MRASAWSEKWLIIHAVTLEAATLCVTYCPVGLRSKMQVHTWVVLKQFSPTGFARLLDHRVTVSSLLRAKGTAVFDTGEHAYPSLLCPSK
jgi:hypothetical protein